MISVSSGFLTAIKQRTHRKVHGKVIIDWTNPEFDQDVVIVVTEAGRVSYNEQLTNGKKFMSHKWLSLDGSTKLDGTYYVMPNQLSEQHEAGWWGKTFALYDGGKFPVYSKKLHGEKVYGEELYGKNAFYPKITLLFSARPVTQLLLMGDSQRNEYAIDFDVEVYDKDGVLQHTSNVTGNGGYTWTEDVDLEDITKIVYTLKKWSHSGRQAKSAELITSIQSTYYGDDIFLIDVLEEREVREGSLPIGNISANEINIRINNVDRLLDAGNPTSKLRNFVKPNRKIQAFLGCEVDGQIEWVPMGVYKSGDWKVPEDEIYAETAGRDLIEALGKKKYSTSTVLENPADTNKAYDSCMDWGGGSYSNMKCDAGFLELDIGGV